MPIVALIAVLCAFILSASAGLGGSLILVPSLALVLGPKEGIALAALLLAGNNLAKVLAYRKTLPFRTAATLILLLALGSATGALLLVNATDSEVGVAVIVSFAVSVLAERFGWRPVRRLGFPLLAFGAGATSGFSGTSGPLKGAALRNLDLDRMHFVGAASLASLLGDLAKTAVFAEASLLNVSSLTWLAAAFPLMIAGTMIGKRFNQEIGERAFRVLFWAVMGGYSVRIGLGVL